MGTIRCGFSERLYEFCVNYELVQTVGALIAGHVPGIPSPQEEAELGWDASFAFPTLGQVFLIQYKVARLTTARWGANAKFWDTYGSPYFRFPLHRDSAGAYTQHAALLDADCLPGVQAVYCAPLLHRQDALAGALATSTVLERSAVIPVGPLGPVAAGAPHSVTYPAHDATGPPTLHSEPRRARKTTFDELRREGDLHRVELTEDVFDEFSALVLERKPRRRRTERAVSARDPRAAAFLRASVVARDELGADLVVI